MGPTVGGALYQVGGYTMPFAVMGSALFLSAILTAFVLPGHSKRGEDKDKGRKYPVIIILKLQIISKRD